ncbi:MAG: cation:proton antiporter [Thermoleophilia bacterium]
MPLAAVADSLLFVELGAVVLALGLLARISLRAGMSPIPSYLLAGVVLGAVAEGPLSFSAELVEVGAQIGLVLLLFMLGLEYSPHELAAGLRTNARAGAADIALNFLPGVIAGVLLDWSLEATLLLGGVTYISSSAVVAKLVGDLGRGGHPETGGVLAVLVIEDLAMAVYLPVMGLLLAGTALWPAAGLVVFALLAVVAVLRLAVRRGHVLSGAIASPSDEAVLLVTLGFGLVAAGVAESLALSAPVGAFLAGVALSGPVSVQARALIAPLRDLLAAAFFILFAQQIDLGELPDVALAAVLLAVVATATKIASSWIGARDLPPAARLRAGTALAARGEFSIVIAGLGVSAGVEPQLGALAAAFVLLTAFSAPLLTRWAERADAPAPTGA